MVEVHDHELLPRMMSDSVEIEEHKHPVTPYSYCGKVKDSKPKGV